MLLCPPNRKGGGDILFFARIPSALASVSASRSFFSVHYLLNPLLYFEQTCIYTVLIGELVAQILVTLTLFSWSQGYFEMFEIWFSCVIF